MQSTRHLCPRAESTLTAAACAALVLCATDVSAAVTISSAATQNMTCSKGTCVPTANKAVLNVGDLETLLGSGSVTVTTTGTSAQASDIHIKSALSWASTDALSLLAKRSIEIDQALTIGGQSGLTIQTGDEGAFSFGEKGNVSFANLSSQLTVNGNAYTLVGDVKTLAADIASNAGGDFALASNYNASGDGIYQSAPVSTVFTGTFEGLGNSISNLSIAGYSVVNFTLYEGLFAEIGPNGVVSNVGLVNADIAGPPKIRNVSTGALAGFNDGTVISSFATGSVTIENESGAGGLVGWNDGKILNCHAASTVSGLKPHIYYEGGLVGLNDQNGTIDDSYATGNVSSKKDYAFAGGLVGQNNGIIANSYASGSAEVIGFGDVGGFVGYNRGSVSYAYSTGLVQGSVGFSSIGGPIGYDQSAAGSLTETYWDTATSGITNLGQGAGNIANDPGITGLTTAQFQSGLPASFDPTVWDEKSNINGGLPYLRSNPPQRHK